MVYGAELKGELYTMAFRLYVTEGNEIISPFHDIPLYPEEGKPWIINAVNEIPRFTNAKVEISRDENMNPIKQDVKDGKVRFIHNTFPYKGYLWNYGAAPQTWESKDDEDVFTKVKGDNDPIDIIEVGAKLKGMGEVYTAKILGCIALLDAGECDWKVIAIDVNDALAKNINGIEDVKREMPGMLEATKSWFQNYKIPAGGKENKFSLDGKYLDRDDAVKVVQEAHRHWRKLIAQEQYEGISLANRRNRQTPGYSQKNFEAPGDAFRSGTEPRDSHSFFFLK
jgi:inorganic pyrophosphatase